MSLSGPSPPPSFFSEAPNRTRKRRHAKTLRPPGPSDPLGQNTCFRSPRSEDQADLAAKRPALTKTAFKARVQAICKTKRAQKVAKKLARMLRTVCQDVVAKQGAASKF